MFRRKEDSDSLFSTDLDVLDAPTESATVITPQAAPASTNGFTPASAQPATPARPAQEVRPTVQAASSFRPTAAPLSGDMARNRMPEAKQPVVTAPVAPQATNVNSEKANKSGKRVLTVGNDILLKGEIATCDRLVIEGKVDATLNDVHTVEIAEGGSFKGSAQIEDAEISGLFEGDLIVRNCLVIRSTGKVRGKISFGEVEIERGGELTGEIKLTSSQPQIGSRRPASTAAAPAAKEENKAAA